MSYNGNTQNDIHGVSCSTLPGKLRDKIYDVKAARKMLEMTLLSHSNSKC